MVSELKQLSDQQDLLAYSGISFLLPELWTDPVFAVLSPVQGSAQMQPLMLRCWFPEGYPFEPLQIQFMSRICHPCVNSDGHFNCDILANPWGSPALTISHILPMIQAALTEPFRSDLVETAACDPILFCAEHPGSLLTPAAHLPKLLQALMETVFMCSNFNTCAATRALHRLMQLSPMCQTVLASQDRNCLKEHLRRSLLMSSHQPEREDGEDDAAELLSCLTVWDVRAELTHRHAHGRHLGDLQPLRASVFRVVFGFLGL